MYKILIAIIILSVTGISYADTSIKMHKEWWNVQDIQKYESGYGDFIIGGCLNKNCSHGTWDDEYAVIGVVAKQIVEHGGYFCPYQMQCAHHKRITYMDLFIPVGSGTWTDRCAWLCEPGYSGPNCMSAGDTPSYCDATPYTTATNGKYGGLKLKTYGQRDNVNEFSNTDFFFNHNWYAPLVSYGYGYLGAIKFLNHGIIATPLVLHCYKRDSISWPKDIRRIQGATQKLLCATGYTANESNTDCVPIDADMCTLQNINMCQNFDKSGYDSSIHYLEDDGGCAKFFCKEPGTAFPAVGKYTCEECAPGIKGGANPKNGVCVKCQTGQYYDKVSNTCKTARAYSKTDMQYGAGQTKNSREIKQQCWTIFAADEYKVCVRNDPSVQNQ